MLSSILSANLDTKSRFPNLVQLWLKAFAVKRELPNEKQLSWTSIILRGKQNYQALFGYRSDLEQNLRLFCPT